jgi:CRISPR/Cas system CSM-associated protein Csm3 (group 7 of RAMP superfamily)
MYELKVNWITKGPLALSNGATDFLYDDDVLTDEYGIPYINQRRIKGLIKEAVKEVCDVCGAAGSKAIIDDIFGKKGDNVQKYSLHISDAIIADKDKIIATIHSKKIPLSFVKNYFTKPIAQTAIDDITHTAKKHSLRKIRAVKEDLVFSFTITTHTKSHKNILALALLQINFIGSNRNRGLGLIGLKDFILNAETDIKPYIAAVTSYPLPKEAHSLNENEVANTSTCNETKEIGIRIKLIGKLIMTEVKGNENIVNSKKSIEGRNLWGFFAGCYLSKYGANEDFKHIFRDGAVCFENAFPVIKDSNAEIKCIPLPSNIQFKKNTTFANNARVDAIDLFDPKLAEKEKTKSKKTFVSGNLLYEPKMVTTFHFNREENQVSGTSTNGELFYYEALEKDQYFYTKVGGRADLVDKLMEAVFGEEEKVHGRIGRSKNVEYGQIELSKITAQEGSVTVANSQLKTFTMYFTSPCIVLNEFYLPEPSVKYLKQALAEKGLAIDNIQAVSNYNTLQHFSSVWHSKTSLAHCFDVGSAFKIELTHDVNEADITTILNAGLGVETNQGYGKAQLVIDLPPNKEFIFKAKNKRTLPNLNDQNHINADHVIGNKYEAHKDSLTLKKNAVIEAQNRCKSKGITNSQLKRTAYLISISNNFETVQNEIKKMKDRPIVNVINDSIGINHHYKVNCSSDYSKFKVFMNQFLATYRLLNNNKA